MVLLTPGIDGLPGIFLLGTAADDHLEEWNLETGRLVAVSATLRSSYQRGGVIWEVHAHADGSVTTAPYPRAI